ncbi:hypothetical protein N7490_012153 [Penicillium lividum]|nr:hypothetical protein N7490_012153 [Penicillium lividum]
MAGSDAPSVLIYSCTELESSRLYSETEISWANYRRRQAKKAKKADETDAAAIDRMRGDLEARNEKIRQEVGENEAIDDFQLAQRSLKPR